MNVQLKKLLEYLLEEELEEQVAISTGGGAVASSGAIAGGSASSAMDPANFSPPPKNKLNEINLVYNGAGLSFSDISNSNMDASQDQGDLTGENDDTKSPRKDRGRDREDNKKHKKKKKFEFRKSKQGYNSTADTMWNYGDKPIYRDGKTGTLPANKVKYIALEEQVTAKKRDTVKIYQDKGHPVSQKSLNVLIDFLKFCNSILKLEDMPDIYLHMIKKPDMTTGMYDRSKHIIHVLFGKRLLVDVMRTIAHELTHARQEETGLLDKHLANVDPMDEMGDIDTVYENEAYTLAGNIVKIFCRKYKRIPKDELYQLNENKRWL
jgi:hypothetical protein